MQCPHVEEFGVRCYKKVRKLMLEKSLGGSWDFSPMMRPDPGVEGRLVIGRSVWGALHGIPVVPHPQLDCRPAAH